MKRRITLIVTALVGLVTILALFAGPSCTEKQLAKGDRIVQDANRLAGLPRAIAQSPAGAMIPSPIREILELLGLVGAAAVAVWQKIRASGILAQKNVQSVAFAAVVDAIDQADPAVGEAIKAKVTDVMKAREITSVADPIVDAHRSKLAA